MASTSTNTSKRPAPLDDANGGSSSGDGDRGKKARADNSSVMHSFLAFGIADFIAPTVAQFLGVRSLVRFSATSKSNTLVVKGEVERRKTRIAEIEAEVKRLMGPQPESVPSRANVMAAKRLADIAKQMIDDEIDFHKDLSLNKLDFNGRYHDRWHKSNTFQHRVHDWRELDFFFNERKKFFHQCYSLSRSELPGSLYILPDCFYFSSDDEVISPCEECMQNAEKKVNKLWGAEGLMSSVYERVMWDPDSDWDRLNYEQPFRKFGLPGAGCFTSFMEAAAYYIVNDDGGLADAFRIAARKKVYFAPASRDCLWYTLEKVDGIASHSDDDSGYSDGNDSDGDIDCSDSDDSANKEYFALQRVLNKIRGKQASAEAATVPAVEQHLQPISTLLTFNDVNLPADQSGGPPPPLAPPAQYTSVSRGILKVEDDGTHCCSGSWAMTNEHFQSGLTSKYHFGLPAHHAAIDTKQSKLSFPIDSTRYKGSFKIRKNTTRTPTIVDDQIVLMFVENSEGSFNVYGKGSNEMGVFDLVGTMFRQGKTAGLLELYRMYPGQADEASAKAVQTDMQRLSFDEQEALSEAINLLPERLLPGAMQIVREDDCISDDDDEIDLDIDLLSIKTQRKLQNFVMENVKPVKKRKQSRHGESDN